MRRVATLGFAVALLPFVPSEAGVGLAVAPAAVAADNWSPTVTIRTADGWYEAPIHATLLPDGRVMMIGVARPTWPATVGTPTRRAAFILNPAAANTVLPAEITPQQLTEPMELDGANFNGLTVNDDLFCAGSTLTSDGKVFIAGGTRAFTDKGAAVVVLGLPYNTMFDPATTTISRVPGNMVVAGSTGTPGRWYPTVTRLPNGKMLIVGGFDRVISRTSPPVYNWSAETYDPATGQRSVAAPFGGMLKQAANPDYTQQWVLPYAGAARDLLVLGEADVPLTTNSASYSSWDQSAPMRPGAAGVTNPGFGQSSTMLELRVNNREFGYSNGSVLVAGGAMDTPLMRQADVYDPITKQWIASVDTGTQRHHPSTITLPDGRVLVITGHNMSGDQGMLRAQYIDPMNGFSVATGSSAMTQIRGYHTTSLLLPDGRVLIAGGRDAATSTSTEKPSLQYYSPDYMTKPRPAIVGATSQIGFKQTFSIVTAGPKPKEAVLVALGSMTHSFDENQRVVQLPVGAVLPGSNGTNVMIAGGPSDSSSAPPGYYMLFVLDQNRVPSVAQMVHIG